MTVIVVDAGVVVSALAGDDGAGAAARERLTGQALVAPELVDLETASVLRRLWLAGKLSLPRATAALQDLADLPVQRVSHVPLLARCWELRDNVTVYDASYVALAELLDVTLVTADARLARASGISCSVELLST